MKKWKNAGLISGSPDCKCIPKNGKATLLFVTKTEADVAGNYGYTGGTQLSTPGA